MSSKIQVNAFIDFDNIKIVAVTKNKDNLICLHNEKINLRKKLKKNEIKKNIRNVLKNIENKTSFKVKSINVIFNDFMKNTESLGITEKIVQDTIEYNEDRFLSSRDCEKIIKSMIEKSKDSEDSLQLISLVPFKFNFVESGSNVEREISSFPIDKKIKKMKVTFSVRYMNKETYLRAIDYFDSLDVKIKNVALESQIAIYSRNFGENQNNTMFTLAIKNDRTVLISSVNDVAIKTEVLNLNYTFSNLVRKIENKFEISNQEAKNLIYSYGKLVVGENEKNEIIYSSNENSKPIRKFELVNIVKSFLKSVCSQANDLVKNKTHNSSKKTEVKIVGKLSRVNELVEYCSKYFENTSLVLEDLNESIYVWNEGYVGAQNYLQFMDILNNKIYPETFYYNSNERQSDRNTYKQEEQIFDVATANADALLA